MADSNRAVRPVLQRNTGNATSFEDESVEAYMKVLFPVSMILSTILKTLHMLVCDLR